MPSEFALLARIAAGFALAFVIGFERELRGSPAGDRTFALVGGAAAAVAATVATKSPQALAGVITGIGFIGAGVVVQYRDAFIRGITTASAIFATAGIGIVVGTGHLGLGAVTTLRWSSSCSSSATSRCSTGSTPAATGSGSATTTIRPGPSALARHHDRVDHDRGHAAPLPPVVWQDAPFSTSPGAT